MNFTITRKTFRDSRWLLVLIPVAIVCFEALIVRAWASCRSRRGPSG